MKKIANDVIIGKNVKVYDFVNLYGCEIGDNTKIGTFVEVQKEQRSVVIVKYRAIHLYVKVLPSRTMCLLAITLLLSMIFIRMQQLKKESSLMKEK